MKAARPRPPPLLPVFGAGSPWIRGLSIRWLFEDYAFLRSPMRSAPLSTATVPPSTRQAPKSYDIGYEIKCRHCGYVESGRVTQLSDSLERQCPNGCGAIVCMSAYLLAPAFTPQHQQEFDLALWPSKAERKEAAPPTNRRHRSVRRKTSRDRARS